MRPVALGFVHRGRTFIFSQRPVFALDGKYIPPYLHKGLGGPEQSAVHPYTVYCACFVPLHMCRHVFYRHSRTGVYVPECVFWFCFLTGIRYLAWLHRHVFLVTGMRYKYRHVFFFGDKSCVYVRVVSRCKGAICFIHFSSVYHGSLLRIWE